jgi:hypothetical protein
MDGMSTENPLGVEVIPSTAIRSPIRRPEVLDPSGRCQLDDVLGL